jgi:tellurite resistance protein
MSVSSTQKQSVMNTCSNSRAKLAAASQKKQATTTQTLDMCMSAKTRTHVAANHTYIEW